MFSGGLILEKIKLHRSFVQNWIYFYFYYFPCMLKLLSSPVLPLSKRMSFLNHELSFASFPYHSKWLWFLLLERRSAIQKFKIVSLDMHGTFSNIPHVLVSIWKGFPLLSVVRFIWNCIITTSNIHFWHFLRFLVFTGK